jgi:hypothetical protein
MSEGSRGFSCHILGKVGQYFKNKGFAISCGKDCAYIIVIDFPQTFKLFWFLWTNTCFVGKIKKSLEKVMKENLALSVFNTTLKTEYMRLEPLISHTGILMTFYLSIILDLQNFFHWYILQSWKLKRPPIQLRPHHFWQEIRIIATGPYIANQLRDVNTIGRRSWYIAAHVWKIYDFKIEVVGSRPAL